MSKALKKVEAEETALTTEVPPQFTFDPADVTLPKILLAQKTSAAVDEGKAAVGDIVNSLSGEKLGDSKNSFEVIPLTMTKVWTQLNKDGNKFIRTIPFTADNKDLPWDGDVEDRDGNTVPGVNQITYQFMVLITKGLEEGEILPAQVSFKSKSAKAGKDLNSLILQLQAMGKPSYMRSVKLGCSVQKNEKGTFHVFSVTKGNPTTPEQQKWAKLWTDTLKKTNVKVDSGAEDLEVEPIDDSGAQY